MDRERSTAGNLVLLSIAANSVHLYVEAHATTGELCIFLSDLQNSITTDPFAR